MGQHAKMLEGIITAAVIVTALVAWGLWANASLRFYLALPRRRFIFNRDWSNPGPEAKLWRGRGIKWMVLFFASIVLGIVLARICK